MQCVAIKVASALNPKSHYGANHRIVVLESILKKRILVLVFAFACSIVFGVMLQPLCDTATYIKPC